MNPEQLAYDNACVLSNSALHRGCLPPSPSGLLLKGGSQTWHVEHGRRRRRRRCVLAILPGEMRRTSIFVELVTIATNQTHYPTEGKGCGVESRIWIES